MSRFGYPTESELDRWRTAAALPSVTLVRIIRRNGRILTLSGLIPIVFSISILVALVAVEAQLDDGAYWSAVIGMVILVGAAGSNWRGWMCSRFPRIALDYYCAVTIFWLKVWEPGNAASRKYAQGPLAVVDALIADPRHAALYASTREARASVASAHRALARNISQKEQDWLRSDGRPERQELIDSIGKALVLRTFGQWTRLTLPDTKNAAELPSNMAPPETLVGQMRDKMLDKMAEAVVIAAGPFMIAVIARFS